MASFKSLPPSFDFVKAEQDILALWDKIDAFKRSIAIRKNSGASAYTFYDGPPFATGLPHYGHMVTSSIKDVIARYWTMRGHYVERRFGWDTHGLPIEMETEKHLQLSGPKSIRHYGIDKFNEACRLSVLRHTKDWERILTRLGRWVDFKHDYKTMDKDFMESVWWVFSELYKKNLVYKGFNVMPYSTRLSTPLSNFEANLNYKNVQDPAVTIKIKLKNIEEYLLIWTTTPWTLVANLAVAVNQDIDYIKVKSEQHIYYVAESLANNILKNGYEVITKIKGHDLIGLDYEPIVSDINYEDILKDDYKHCFKIIASDHVTAKDGTGLVHMAPAFGADDFKACVKENIPIFDPIDEEGKFNNIISWLDDIYFKDADKIIIKKLKEDNKVFIHSTTLHSYPFCWRSNTPLIYKAVPVWFIKVSNIKEKLSEHNKNIHWVPSAIGHKRFANWLSEAQDWSISRNRFFGTPIPIWRCSFCGHEQCLSSAQELSDLSQMTIHDLHSHYVDHIIIPCLKCENPMKRISEVFDCWFESGSMPYAQVHYPFEHNQEFAQSFPADFIAEGLDQTRGWFYTLLVISTALFDKPPFKNVIVNGMVLAADGEKMSKSKQNFPDPEFVLNTYGADAVRIYLINSPAVKGEPLKFDEQGVKEIVKSILLPLYHCWSFLVQYAIIDKFDPKTDLTKAPPLKKRPEIDQWIISKINSLIKKINEDMDDYYLYKIIPPTLDFIDDLTNWYIRRSRRRFWKTATNDQDQDDKLAAYATLYEILTSFIKILAPLTPFLSETIYQNLVCQTDMANDDEDSVHLCLFPKADDDKINYSLEKETAAIRLIVTLGRALREKYRIKTRQPLKSITVVGDDNIIFRLKDHEELITSELNVKQLIALAKDDDLCQISCKPNYKILGPKAGKAMAQISKEIALLDSHSIKTLEKGGTIFLSGLAITIADITIIREAKTDMIVMSDQGITVALNTEIDQSLQDEGLMRELLSQLQRLRKNLGLMLTDRIDLKICTDNIDIIRSITHHKAFLMAELLANNINISKEIEDIKNANQLTIDNITIGAALSIIAAQ